MIVGRQYLLRYYHFITLDTPGLFRRHVVLMKQTSLPPVFPNRLIGFDTTKL